MVITEIAFRWFGRSVCDGYGWKVRKFSIGLTHQQAKDRLMEFQMEIWKFPAKGFEEEIYARFPFERDCLLANTLCASAKVQPNPSSQSKSHFVCWEIGNCQRTMSQNEFKT
jgi:hypothetical protein